MNVSATSKNVSRSGDIISRSRHSLGMLGGITVSIVFAIFIFNRAAAKIGFGPLFLLDAVFLLNVVVIGRVVLRNFSLFKYAILVAVVSIVWLADEVLSNEFGPNNIRRTAMALYLFVPAIIIPWGGVIYEFLYKYSHIIAVGVVGFSSSGILADFQPSVSSQVLAFLLLWQLYSRDRNRFLKSIVIAVAFLLVVSGFSSGGAAYRTPVVGLVSGLVIATIIIAFRGATFRVRFKSIRILGVGFLLSLVVFTTFASNAVVGQFLAGASGLLGVKYAASSAVSNRERGDSAGTAETRTTFWTAIIENSIKDPPAIIRGTGHYLSFFERTRPYEGFVDEDLLEPHNSFLGIYYRYGLLGLIPLLMLLKKTRLKERASDAHRAFAVATYVLAFNYCFFEVVLEGPHGALIFWLMWLAPLYYKRYARN